MEHKCFKIYTRADLKISQHVCVHIKMILWIFGVLNPKNELFTRKVCKVFVYKDTNTIEHIKK